LEKNKKISNKCPGIVHSSFLMRSRHLTVLVQRKE